MTDRTLFTIMLLVALLTACATLSSASHDPQYAWMGGCCGKVDCRPAHVSIVRFRVNGQTMVLVNGAPYTLRQENVRPTQDEHEYVCLILPSRPIAQNNLRCVFYRIGA